MLLLPKVCNFLSPAPTCLEASWVLSSLPSLAVPLLLLPLFPTHSVSDSSDICLSGCLPLPRLSILTAQWPLPLLPCCLCRFLLCVTSSGHITETSWGRKDTGEKPFEGSNISAPREAYMLIHWVRGLLREPKKKCTDQSELCFLSINHLSAPSMAPRSMLLFWTRLKQLQGLLECTKAYESRTSDPNCFTSPG